MIWMTLAFADPLARVERLDLFSEEGGSWWIDEVPRAGVTPRTVALRWAEQLRLGVAIPEASLVVGISAASQSVSIRRPLTHRAPLYASAGVSTSLGLPRGALAGIEYWRGPVRLAVGMHVHSQAVWARPRFDSWRALPGIGIGVGRPPLPW